jgi:hypothetical protein
MRATVASGIGGAQKDGALIIDMRHFTDIQVHASGIAEVGPGKYVVVVGHLRFDSVQPTRSDRFGA